MLQLALLREQPEVVIAGLRKKFVADPETAVRAVLELDQRRRAAQTALDDNLARQNQLAREIGPLMQQKRAAEAEALKAEATQLKAAAAQLKTDLEEVEHLQHAALVKLPNLPHSSVPEGRTPQENEVVREVGAKPTLPDNAQPHWDIIKRLDIIDFELGNKITGAGFPVYKNQGARLQRALINFFLDEARAAGYDEIQPPILVNEASGYGTGQLPDKDGQMYHDAQDNLYLIPTAEVPITNLYRDEIIPPDRLPIRNAGYTPCFRREAGSWGADVRGLNRLHQFDKVEIVQISAPETSYQQLEEMLAHIESLLQKLDLHYRVLRLCGGDMSFTSALTYDLEVYSAAQGRWLEVSSCSNFETYQANRLKLRYKAEGGKTQLLHTLNGSALALPRIVAALLENNQEADGRIWIPEALRPYCGFDCLYTHELPIKPGPDYTKYWFEGDAQEYGKTGLVNSIVKRYVRENPLITGAELMKVFSSELQGTEHIAVVKPLDYAERMRVRERKRYKMDAGDVISLVDGEYVTSTQWGIHNIGNIIAKASELGYFIHPIR